MDSLLCPPIGFGPCQWRACAGAKARPRSCGAGRAGAPAGRARAVRGACVRSGFGTEGCLLRARCSKLKDAAQSRKKVASRAASHARPLWSPPRATWRQRAARRCFAGRLRRRAGRWSRSRGASLAAGIRPRSTQRWCAADPRGVAMRRYFLVNTALSGRAEGLGSEERALSCTLRCAAGVPREVRGGLQPARARGGALGRGAAAATRVAAGHSEQARRAAEGGLCDLMSRPTTDAAAKVTVGPSDHRREPVVVVG